jgi:hypothetical protein
MKKICFFRQKTDFFSRRDSHRRAIAIFSPRDDYLIAIRKGPSRKPVKCRFPCDKGLVA